MSHLPSPPTDKEKYLYIDQNKWLIYGWAIFSLITLLTGMVFFAKISFTTALFWPFIALTAFYLIISYFIGIFGKPFNIHRHEVKKNYYFARWHQSNPLEGTVMAKPSIDVYLPSAGEDLKILNNTFKHVRLLDWPEGRLHVYVLDDSHRRDVELLADRYEFHYIKRPNKGELKKAGNIRYAFPRTSGDFILILDADFAPRPDMIKEMIPYTLDPNCAIVQSPQFFTVDPENPWITNGAAYIQELFYRMIQVHRDHFKAAICVGTNALYRRQALEPFGGTYPIEFSEDMHTGWLLTTKGLHVKYIPVNLAKGLCPESMSAFFIQQTRWCQGSVGLFLSKKFWKEPLSPMTRLCYVSGMMYYIATATAVILGPIPALVVAWIYPSHVFWYNFLWALPSFLMSIVVMNYWSKAPWHFSVLSTRLVSYYAHIFALLTLLKGKTLEWIPSGNTASTKRAKVYPQFKTAILLWSSLVFALGLTGAARHMTGPLDLNFYPLIFFSTFNYLVAMLCLRHEA